MTKFRIFILCSFSVSGICASQAPAEPEEASCRCCEAGRIYAPWVKNLARPKKRDFIGNATLDVTTKSKEAQAYCNLGINYLHAFWEIEAYRCFLTAIELDPDCAMAYWGVCMSLPGKLSEASKEREIALQQAKENAPKASKKEQLYIKMVDQLILGGPQLARPVLEEILKLDSSDSNAAAFLALWMRDGYNTKGEPKEGTKKSIALLEKHLKRDPDHLGLIHYYIHAVEGGKHFTKATPYLSAMETQGKGSGHLAHMPGHIYFLNGEYDKASEAFTRCFEIESNYFKEDKIHPVDLPNYSHNLHFWAITEAERGRYKEALRIAKLLQQITQPTNRDNTGVSENAYQAAIVEAKVHMRFREYTKAMKSLSDQQAKIKKNTPLWHYVAFLHDYCSMMDKMYSTPDWSEIFELTETLKKHLNAYQSSSSTSEFDTIDKKRASNIMKVLVEQSKIYLDNADPSNKMDLSLVGPLFKMEARLPFYEPPPFVASSHEMLGYLCLHRNELKTAETYFKKALVTRPKSGHIHQGLILCYQKSNQSEQLEKEAKTLLQVWKDADADLAGIKAANAITNE